LLAWLFAIAQLTACSSLPPLPERPATQMRAAAWPSPLGTLVAESGVPQGRSGFRPLAQSAAAMNVRLTLIRQASDSIDVQTFLIGNDATGHEVLRALRDASRRGVRIRLLLDDMHTQGMTDLLLGLAAHPNVELRLYNPFPAGRDGWLGKAWSLATDFERLNRRMHNKLFIADGRVAIVGGRNLADEYFMRSASGNFIDLDLLCLGSVVEELGRHFDEFWNSAFAYPIESLVDNGLDLGRRRENFDILVRQSQGQGQPASPLRDLGLMPRSGRPGLLTGSTGMTVADASVFFDSPDKTAGLQRSGDALPVAALLAAAEQQVLLITPYFLPSKEGLSRLAAARARGVDVQVLTNSYADSDEPLVSLAYGRYRPQLLQLGIRLFEMSSDRLKDDDRLRRMLGDSAGSLHAKLAFVDEQTLLVGSLNLDPRSARTNTELALVIRSPELTRQVLGELQSARTIGVHEVRLAADGRTLEWIAHAADGSETVGDEPVPSLWQRLQLWLALQLVPEDLL
jgi:cardiolipin synthase C